MEEIYKPETEDAGKVEVYSRENNEMLGDMPQWLIHTGSYIVYGLVSIRPRACFFPLFSFLPLWLHYNLNPLCVQY